MFFSVEYPTTSHTEVFVPTSTITVLDTVPPAPLQLKVYVWLEPRLPVLWLPLVDLVPVQAPDAVHSVAFVELQLRADAAPIATEVGVAESVTVGVAGAGAPATVTDTD